MANVMPAAVLARRKAEQETLHSARQQAEQLLKAAEADAVRLRQQAIEAGLAEGRRQAMTHQVSLAEQLALFRDAARQEIADVFEQGLAHVLAGPAREAFFSGFIEQAQQLLGRMRFARLQVHPDDEILVRALVHGSSLQGADCPVSIECDPALRSGDCALVSDAGKVSVSLQLRLDDVKNVLGEVFGHWNHPPPGDGGWPEGAHPVTRHGEAGVPDTWRSTDGPRGPTQPEMAAAGAAGGSA
jgi:type III secretion protein L